MEEGREDSKLKAHRWAKDHYPGLTYTLFMIRSLHYSHNKPQDSSFRVPFTSMHSPWKAQGWGEQTQALSMAGLSRG